jgi:hypothetical protein
VSWKLADLFVQITGNSSALNGTLAMVKGQLLGMGGLGGRLGMQLAEGIAGPLLGLSGTAALAVGGIAAGAVAAAGGLVYAGKVASDLNETIAKTEQVFGSATTKVTDAANEMARAFGIPKAEFLDAASMFGLIAQGAGVASGKAADMSVGLAKLAADASSFYNTGVDVALEKIRAGLVGESEPLRAFGVMLSEDAVKAKALAMGLARPGQELTNQMKIMARYQLIQEGLAKASGDLERTGGGFANQWRQFTGQLTNLAGTIGMAVLPAMTYLLRGVNTAMSGIAGLADWVGSHWERFASRFQGVGSAIMSVMVPVFNFLERGFTFVIEDALAKLGFLGRTLGAVLDFFGLVEHASGDDATRTAERADIDARNQKMADQLQADEAQAQGAKAHDRKAWQGGLEEYAKNIREAAAGGKDSHAKQMLGIQKQQLSVAQQLLEEWKKKQPDRGAAAALAT